MPQLNVVCYYADIGNHAYLPLIRRMCQSAKAVMPDCRTVLLTPTQDRELWDYFDHACHFDSEVTPENLCSARARATVGWQMVSDSTSIFVDPDVVFKKPVDISDDADVMFSWRQRAPAQPINSGLVITRPGFHGFWKKYGSAAVNMPKPLAAWWCDQLAYNVLVGTSHNAGDVVPVFGARCKLIDCKTMCATPDDATEDTWTVHYKGQRKWNQTSPSPDTEKSGAGRLSPACV